MTKIKNQCMGFMLTAIPLLSLSTPCMAQNPYLPLWENLEYSKTLTTQGSTELTS